MTYYYDIPLSHYTTEIVVATTIHDLLGALAMFFAKTSVFLMYRRIFGPNRTMLYVIYIGIGISFLIYWAILPLDLYLCFPRPGELWTDASLGEACGHEEKYSIILGTWNSLVDIYLLVLPIPVVWNLKMSIGRKIGVLSLFMTGLLGLVVSAVSLWSRVEMMKNPGGWIDAILAIMISTENNIAIICSCIPAAAQIPKRHGSYEKLSLLGRRIASWTWNLRSSRGWSKSSENETSSTKESSEVVEILSNTNRYDEERA